MGLLRRHERHLDDDTNNTSTTENNTSRRRSICGEVSSQSNKSSPSSSSTTTTTTKSQFLLNKIKIKNKNKQKNPNTMKNTEITTSARTATTTATTTTTANNKQSGRASASASASASRRERRRMCTSVQRVKLCDGRHRVGIYTGQVDPDTNLPHGQGTMKYVHCYHHRKRQPRQHRRHFPHHTSTDNNETDVLHSYEGSWYDGIWNGYALLTYISSSGDDPSQEENDNEEARPTTTTATTYEGPFLDGHKHGLFVVRYDDGRVYDGSYRMDQIQRGHMDIPNVGRYYGDFDLYDRPHGRGKLVFEDGKQYDGEFLHGQIDGHGRMVYGNLFVNENESVSYRSIDSSSSFDSDIDSDIDSDSESHSDRCMDPLDASGKSSWSLTSTITATASNSKNIAAPLNSRNNTIGNGPSPVEQAAYSFYLGSFSNGKRYGKGVLMIDEEIIHDGHWHDDEPSSSPGISNTQQRPCLGRIPSSIQPTSRFSPRKNKKKDMKKKDNNNNNNNKAATKGNGQKH